MLLAVLASALVLGGGTASGGQSERYPYRLKVDAVAYHLPGKTALGIPVRRGVVAVDPRLIPLGTRLHVPGYGHSIAADVGVAIKGRLIDLWMPSTRAARAWGRRTVRITVYR
jgi:3D (Asp-Asp-Asp) domain-containing protein